MTNQNIWDHHYTRDRSRQLYPDENVVRVLKKNFPLPEFAKTPGTRALDLGSGSGRHLPIVSEHFAEIIACDFSRESLKLSSGGAVKCVQTALPDLPFAAEVFDFILCWGVLHYLPPEQIAPALHSIREILKPGASVFLTLRADSDTHLQRQLQRGDLAGGHAQLLSKEKTLSLFAAFSSVQYGYIARQPVGEEGIVAHHMILANR